MVDVTSVQCREREKVSTLWILYVRACVALRSIELGLYFCLQRSRVEDVVVSDQYRGKQLGKV